MTALKRLKMRAKESCEWRGHNMSYFKQKPCSTAHDSFCINCGAMVVVQVNPPANGINIGGEAVALNCPKLIQ
jgi:hypothetical protein